MSWSDSQQRLKSLGYPIAVDGQPGKQTYGALFAYMGAKANAPLLGQSAAEHFPAYRIDSPLRVSHWFAQFAHESGGFTSFTEDLRYSAQRLCAVWPKRFPTPASAQPYASNPEALANKVYGGRMGNTQPGDGWRFIGRGPQLTGRDNYTACASRTGLDLVNHPELAAKPENFVHIACDFWAQHCCNALADKDDLRGITLAINGGTVGYAERAVLLVKAKRVLS